MEPPPAPVDIYPQQTFDVPAPAKPPKYAPSVSLFNNNLPMTYSPSLR